MSTIRLPSSKPTPASEEFSKVYREFAPLVYRTAWGVLGSREDAEDVSQIVFLKLLRRESLPDLQKNPRAYLCRAAITVSLDVLRARHRRPTTALDEAVVNQVSAGVTEGEFDEELHERLYSGIARLSPGAAEVLILRYMNNKSTSEIGAILGVSRTVIAVRLFRARLQLKKLFVAGEL